MAKNDSREGYSDVSADRWESVFNKKYQYERCPKCQAEITFDKTTTPNTYHIKITKKCSKCDWVGEAIHDETRR